jgi:hypothetical protein
VIVDKSHSGWAAVTALLLLVLSACYGWYSSVSPDGVRGGTLPGLAFGIIAAGLMVFAGLLAVRKKLIGWSLGPVAWWLKGHIWLGLLSLPVTLFHTGFRFGGTVEQFLMWTYLVVMASGIVGLFIQQYIPRLMKVTVPEQGIFEQVPMLVERLRTSADKTITAAVGSLFGAEEVDEESGYAPEGVLRSFYMNTARPYLAQQSPEVSPLANATQADGVFAQLAEALPDRLHAAVEELRQIVEERRQLVVQLRLQKWLHGWLLIHIPACIVLLVAGLLHIVSAIYY